jgi:selenocysteine-specific translation elongation factor
VASALTVAIVGSTAIAGELGKKGTVSDVTLYHDVHGERAVTLVTPSQFPEKVAPLAVALAMADAALLVVDELSRPIAETIAVVDLSDVPATVVVGPAVGEGDAARVLKGTRLEGSAPLPLDPLRLRAHLDGLGARTVDGPVEVPIDHAFPVKGVGTVALGLVRRGTLKAHDRLRLYPGPKTVEVRSIQVHDVDRTEAACGERVGVALKGVDADEVARGQILAPEGSFEPGRRLGGTLARCRYYRGDAGPGAQLQVAVGLQLVPALVDRLDGDTAEVTTDRPVAARPGSPAYLFDLSVSSGPRILGRLAIGSIGAG